MTCIPSAFAVAQGGIADPAASQGGMRSARPRHPAPSSHPGGTRSSRPRHPAPSSHPGGTRSSRSRHPAPSSHPGGTRSSRPLTCAPSSIIFPQFRKISHLDCEYNNEGGIAPLRCARPFRESANSAQLRVESESCRIIMSWPLGVVSALAQRHGRLQASRNGYLF